MPTYSAPIVGMYFYNPAQALLKVLAADTPLSLVREPDNIHDPNAIKVMLRSVNIPADAYEELEVHAAGHGYDVATILEQAEWQLGHIAREYAAALQPIMDDPRSIIQTKLGFDAKGKPLAFISVAKGADPNDLDDDALYD